MKDGGVKFKCDKQGCGEIFAEAAYEKDIRDRCPGDGLGSANPGCRFKCEQCCSPLATKKEGNRVVLDDDKIWAIRLVTLKWIEHEIGFKADSSLSEEENESKLIEKIKGCAKKPEEMIRYKISPKYRDQLPAAFFSHLQFARQNAPGKLCDTCGEHFSRQISRDLLCQKFSALKVEAAKRRQDAIQRQRTEREKKEQADTEKAWQEAGILESPDGSDAPIEVTPRLVPDRSEKHPRRRSRKERAKSKSRKGQPEAGEEDEV